LVGLDLKDGLVVLSDTRTNAAALLEHHDVDGRDFAQP
jgi:predicted proteasome-type protease